MTPSEIVRAVRFRFLGVHFGQERSQTYRRYLCRDVFPWLKSVGFVGEKAIPEPMYRADVPSHALELCVIRHFLQGIAFMANAFPP